MKIDTTNQTPAFTKIMTGSVVAKLRKKAEYTTIELCKIMRKHPSNWNKIERGNLNLTMHDLMIFLDVTKNTFLEFQNEILDFKCLFQFLAKENPEFTQHENLMFCRKCYIYSDMAKNKRMQVRDAALKARV